MTLNPLASVFRRCAFAMLSTRSSSVNTGITKSSTPLQNMPHESESFQSVGVQALLLQSKQSRPPILLSVK
jgi:hypothetical protein